MGMKEREREGDTMISTYRLNVTSRVHAKAGHLNNI